MKIIEDLLESALARLGELTEEDREAFFEAQRIKAKQRNEAQESYGEDFEEVFIVGGASGILLDLEEEAKLTLDRMTFSKKEVQDITGVEITTPDAGWVMVDFSFIAPPTRLILDLEILGITMMDERANALDTTDLDFPVEGLLEYIQDFLCDNFDQYIDE